MSFSIFGSLYLELAISDVYFQIAKWLQIKTMHKSKGKKTWSFIFYLISRNCFLSFCLIFHLSGYHTFFPYNSPFVKNVKKDEKPFLVSWGNFSFKSWVLQLVRKIVPCFYLTIAACEQGQSWALSVDISF